jgi:hypothetical protein
MLLERKGIAMEDRLKAILSTVNDWLRFAELKNGALLTFATGLILALVRSYPQFSAGSKVKWCYATAIILISLSSLVSLLSFIPKLEIPWFESEQKPKDDDNLYFFGDIAKFSASHYVTSLLIANGEAPRAITRLETNLAVQSIVNSRIARKKYWCFNVAVSSLLIALLLLCITGIILL